MSTFKQILRQEADEALKVQASKQRVRASSKQPPGERSSSQQRHGKRSSSQKRHGHRSSSQQRHRHRSTSSSRSRSPSPHHGKRSSSQQRYSKHSGRPGRSTSQKRQGKQQKPHPTMPFNDLIKNAQGQLVQFTHEVRVGKDGKPIPCEPEFCTVTGNDPFINEEGVPECEFGGCQAAYLKAKEEEYRKEALATVRASKEESAAVMTQLQQSVGQMKIGDWWCC